MGSRGLERYSIPEHEDHVLGCYYSGMLEHSIYLNLLQNGMCQGDRIMFNSARAFNQALAGWNVSNVKIEWLVLCVLVLPHLPSIASWHGQKQAQTYTNTNLI